ncbi:MAG TPA: type II secretion system F family protein [Candidatus Limnocylindrales bacterium]|nr:type II secretion system F family protein [Candidatus Limnocylindrales bacterium]
MIVLIGVLALALMLVSPAIGIVVFGYGVVARKLVIRRRERAQAARRMVATLDLLASAAADLRAGSAPPLIALPVRDVDRFARAARRLSDRTGAALADLLERLEVHQRALSRLDATAYAQAAGARLTALILIALPALALLLGHSIGADALGILFQTHIGFVCTAIAVALQLAGLAWTDRLSRSRTDPLHAELAVASDLMAAALRAGSPVPSAVLHVGDVLEGPLSASLTQIGRELAAGVSPKQAWQRIGRLDAARRLTNAAQRTSESGAAMSGALTRCADDLRVDAAHERQARVQRASVLLMLPLGLCFLPAFLLAGLVPVVLAVISEVL